MKLADHKSRRPTEVTVSAVASLVRIASVGAVVAVSICAVAFIIVAPRYTTDWNTVWASAAAACAFLTVVVLLSTAIFAAGAAFFAGSQVEITRESTRVALTYEVLNAPWTAAGANALNRFVTLAGSVAAARSRNEERLLELAAKEDADAMMQDLSRSIIRSYIYLSRLYARGVIDKDLFVETGCVAVARASYIFEPAFKDMLRRGYIEPDVLRYAKDSISYIKQRPQLVLVESWIDGWSL